MITSLAHTALHVGDVDTAVAWYRDILGMQVLSPPYRMDGEQITADMGELVPAPVAIVAAIVGWPGDDDRVLEIVEYPNAGMNVAARTPTVLVPGFTHVGLVCDDVAATRSELEARGVTFLTSGVAEVAGLRTTWFTDPWGNVFILMEKRTHPDRPYHRQY
jgi:catechol 2,3-dioxygenase-like lactoylglutathione lyase family enzyme